MLVAPAGFEVARELAASDSNVTFEIMREGVAFVCKRLSTRMRREEAARRAMTIEGVLLRLLDGRGAPRLIDAGEDDAGNFVVMERVEWPTLASRENGKRDAAWFERAARASFAALAAIHAARDVKGALAIVHGDLSPHNVAISEDGATAAIFDFGLARYRDAPSGADANGAFRGTALYAAPELARGESIDLRADVFALAASWLHAWSGHRPHAPVDLAPLLLAAAEESLADYASRASRELSPRFAGCLKACLAFDRKDRPSSAHDAANAW
jgi:serine/threonine protein kinase